MPIGKLFRRATVLDGPGERDLRRVRRHARLHGLLGRWTPNPSLTFQDQLGKGGFGEVYASNRHGNVVLKNYRTEEGWLDDEELSRELRGYERLRSIMCDRKNKAQTEHSRRCCGLFARATAKPGGGHGLLVAPRGIALDTFVEKSLARWLTSDAPADDQEARLVAAMLRTPQVNAQKQSLRSSIGDARERYDICWRMLSFLLLRLDAALRCMQESSVGHNDLKPANVIVYATAAGTLDLVLIDWAGLCQGKAECTPSVDNSIVHTEGYYKFWDPSKPEHKRIMPVFDQGREEMHAVALSAVEVIHSWWRVRVRAVKNKQIPPPNANAAAKALMLQARRLSRDLPEDVDALEYPTRKAYLAVPQWVSSYESLLQAARRCLLVPLP
jgi:hypothetical protein